MTTLLFEINITADGGKLCIDVSLPATVDDVALDALLSQIFLAFDLVDGSSKARSREQLMKSLT